MLIYLLLLLVIAIAVTVWSMRDMVRKPDLPKQRTTHHGSIVLLKDTVKHYDSTQQGS